MCEDGTPTDINKDNKCLVKWFSSNSNVNGPVTAMTYLHNATEDWVNMPNMILNYIDEGSTETNGYGTIKTIGNITTIRNKKSVETAVIKNLKSRLPKNDEVHGENKCLTFTENGNKYGSCPLWLVNYLTSSEYVTGEEIQNISGIVGYWTLSSYSYDTTKAWFVGAAGHIYYGGAANDDQRGVRPVINIRIK